MYNILSVAGSRLRRERGQNRYASSIRVRIIGLFSFALLALLSANLALYQRAAFTIREQTITALLNNLHSVMNGIDRTLETLDTFAVSTNLNDDLRAYLATGTDITEYQRYVVTSNLRQLLNEIRFSHTSVDSVYAYSAVSDAVYGTEMIRSAYGAEMGSPWHALLTGRRVARWTPVRSLPPLDSAGKNLLTSVTPIRNRSMTDLVGVIAINVNERYLRRFFDGIVFGSGAFPFILDAEGVVLSHEAPELVGTRYVHAELLPDGTPTGHVSLPAGSTAMLLFGTSPYTGWRYAAEISIRELSASIAGVRNFTVLMSVAALLLASIPIVLVSRGIVSPVRRLADHMERAGRGDLSPRLEPDRGDEFGILFRSFNEMVSNASAMIDDLYVQRLLRNEMQLKMIQSQINSHFLYNTLDAIHWTAREHGLDDVCRMTQGLADYLRKNLSDGKESLPLRDVASLLESYVAIQNTRYDGRFAMVMRIDPDLLDLQVLKFLFQPLVENAVTHGYDESRETQRIWIDCAIEDDDTITFTVQDEGPGIAADRLADIQANLAGSDQRTGRGFALKNIHSLIKLYYGAAYGLSISNCEGGGAIVRLAFPACRSGSSAV